jgi:hypothetical protein
MSDTLLKEANHLLKNVLQRLEKITDEVTATQGFNPDTEKLKLLVELTREQVKNENPGT